MRESEESKCKHARAKKQRQHVFQVCCGTHSHTYGLMTSWRLRPAGLGLCRPTRHLWDTEDRFARFKRRFKRRSSFLFVLLGLRSTASTGSSARSTV